MKTAVLSAVACLFAGSAQGFAELHVATNPQVTIPNLGTVEGRSHPHNGVHVDEFLGIKYASAPRFESPIPEAPWTGVRMADKYGATCMGSLCKREEVVRPADEECLFLNVFRASALNSKANTTANGLLPVLFFIHGGAYQYGCSDQYAGESVVARSKGDVLVVTINYRLGAFGFLGSDKLKGKDGSTGNWGFQDQRVALQWAKEHISAFGGDPERITVSGQSAGAGSISCHMTSAKSRDLGLFKRVATMSGLGATWAAQSLSNAKGHYKTLLKNTKCSDNDCLKAMSAVTLLQHADRLVVGLKLAHSLVWGPVIDQVELTMQPWEYFEKGEHVENVDILSGSTKDEFAYFMLELEMNDFMFTMAMTPMLKNAIFSMGELKKLYKDDNFKYPAELGSWNSWWWKAMSAYTDASFTCTNRRNLKWLHKKNPNMYNYFFVHATQSITDVPGDQIGSVIVPHCEELPYVFDCPAYPRITSCDWAAGREDEKQLAQDVSILWINFVKDGHPGETWTKKYDPTTDESFIIDLGTKYGGGGFRYEAHVRDKQCNFWDKNLFP
eukprot:Rhum_TRINITY_DN14118_c0_g1::Rhum_TRINITY_DN14118_c0_g1_i1::g.69742::m.69742